MASVTATPEPGNVPPRILLEVDFSDITPVPTQVLVHRVDAAGMLPVREADPAGTTSGRWTGYDYEAPFRQNTAYQASPVGSSGNVVGSPMVSLDVAVPWLIHPGVPDLSVPLTRLKAGSWQTVSRRTRRGVFHVPGRPEPVPVTAGARSSAESVMVVAADTLDEARALEDILRDESVLLLRIPADRDWGAPQGWVSIGDTDQVFLTATTATRMSSVSLPYFVAPRPPGGIAAQRTWADLVAAYDTWGEVLAAHDTWQDVLLGTPTGAPDA